HAGRLGIRMAGGTLIVLPRAIASAEEAGRISTGQRAEVHQSSGGRRSTDVCRVGPGWMATCQPRQPGSIRGMKPIMAPRSRTGWIGHDGSGRDGMMALVTSAFVRVWGVGPNSASATD